MKERMRMIVEIAASEVRALDEEVARRNEARRAGPMWTRSAAVRAAVTEWLDRCPPQTAAELLRAEIAASTPAREDPTPTIPPRNEG